MKKSICLFLVTVVVFALGATPFPADKMTGSWRMSKIYPIEVDPGNGTPPSETEQRLALTLTFLGNGRCSVVQSHSALSREDTTFFDFKYSDGTILFTKINGKENEQIKDQLLGMVKASRFHLVRIDDNAFEMRYADLPMLAKCWLPVGASTTKYLKNGILEAKTTLPVGGRKITMTERHPPMVFKRMTVNAVISESIKVPDYRIREFERTDNNDFSYRFKLEFHEKTKVPDEILNAILTDFKVAIIEDYSESYSDVDISTLYVNFPKCEQHGGMLEVQSEVLAITVTSFAYSTQTREGRIVVKFNAEQVEEARRYVRRNISAIARDKNIALITGEVPPEATISIVKDEVGANNTLEVVFKALN